MSKLLCARLYKSIFDASAALLKDLHMGNIQAERLATIYNLITGEESQHSSERLGSPGYYRAFSRTALAASESKVGNRCSKDQSSAIRMLNPGVSVILGPPGTGVDCQQTALT
jgi:hypothetical protein